MMKKVLFGMLGAIALTFVACSSEDEVANVNPTYDGSAVKAEFAFNITKAAQTRMSADNTQEAGNSFLGMRDMYLLAFSDGGYAQNQIDGTETATTNYPLGELANTEISTTNSKKIYALTIPVGTDNFVFYGRAPQGTNKANGAVTTTLTENTKALSAVNFGLTQIANALGDDATNIAAYLTAVARAEGWAGTVTTSATDGNYLALAQLYNNFTGINANESRAGSAEGVVRTILDLYKSAKAINQNSSVAGVQTIAGAIVTAINTAVSGVKVTVTDTDADPKNWTAEATGFNATFPQNLNLPMGATRLVFNSGTFTYTNPYYAAGADMATVAVGNIDYPAELIYFDNSPLAATDEYKEEEDFPATVALWDSPVNTTNGFDSDWSKNSTVAPTTRAVAMQNNINYGVALLETSVKLAQNNLTDNRAQIVGGDATNQTDIDGTKFKVTGILIGGQPAQVEWDMTHTADETFSNVIYDSEITFKETPLSTTESANNWTVVFDNYTKAADQKDVLVALEILNPSVENGGKDFYGKYNVIPAGHTFYLVGKLSLEGKTWTPADRTNDGAYDNVYRVTKETVGRVFVQDYKTKATFTISDDALQQAYNTVPDLTTTQTIFGLSVDLKWETGLTFNVEI